MMYTDHLLSQEKYNGLHGAYFEWLCRIPAQIIVHGNFRLGRFYGNREGQAFRPMTVEIAKDAIETSFLKRASRRVYGSKRIEMGHRLFFGGMIEGSGRPDAYGCPRFHAHLGIFGIPEVYCIYELCRNFKGYWEEMHWGFGHTVVEPCHGDGWRQYCLKTFSPNQTERFVTNMPFDYDGNALAASNCSSLRG